MLTRLIETQSFAIQMNVSQCVYSCMTCFAVPTTEICAHKAL